MHNDHWKPLFDSLDMFSPDFMEDRAQPRPERPKMIFEDARDIAIRPATAADLEAINDIYNHYVLHSTCTYQLEPETAADRRAWFDRRGPLHPVIVADFQGDVVGWGSLSPLRASAGYRHTVENSVYVRHDCHQRGIGGNLLKDLIDLSRQPGHRTIIAIIDAEQAASIALHAKFGFRQVAHLCQVGYKFDRWLDVVYMQLMLS